MTMTAKKAKNVLQLTTTNMLFAAFQLNEIQTL